MPKRKRAHYVRDEVDSAQELDLKRVEIGRKLVHGKKLLNRALKTARGFEWQKLSKRIKLATKEQDETEAGRLQKELGVVKTLDLSIAVDSHLYKTILKSKSIQESGLLPSYVKAGTKWNEVLPEELSAISNVTARLYNTKPVKEVMARIMGSLYAILGIQNPLATMKNKIKEKVGLGNKDGEEANSAEHNVDEGIGGRNSPSADKYPRVFEVPTNLATSDLDSNSKSDLESDDAHESDDMHDVLVVGSSSEESTGDVDITSTNGHSNSNPGTPEQPNDTSNSLSRSSLSPSPPPRPRKSTKAQQSPSKPGSTFLPTLMGGYWSGSESATDDEDTSTRKKNRPGQQARRALWEKKYGAGANHLKGQASCKSRDKDWDPRRGARGAEDGRYTGGKAAGRGGKAVFVKNKGQSTGENRVAVKPRARGMGKKDDEGPLHPSWEAAKKAKEAKQSAPFQGKKVVFE